MSNKSIYIISSSIALGIGAYAAYRYWKQRDSKCVDEGFEDVAKLDETTERILVLGLESAGKTTLMSQITTGSLDVKNVKPTEGFNVTNLTHKTNTVNIWEVGGGEKIRKFWSNFLQDTDLLIFVVDAADTHEIVHTVKEFKTVAGDERLKNVPILLVASKQDLPGALSPKQIGDALDISSISPSKHAIRVFGTYFDPNQVHPSVLELKKAILEFL